MLTRWSWPGNAGQLLATLRELGQHRRAGVIVPADLAPEIRTTSRRRLSHLESLERTPSSAAWSTPGVTRPRQQTLLGVSRATIYRKIHDYGIVDLT